MLKSCNNILIKSLQSFIIIFNLSIPVNILTSSLLSTMCPFLTSCSTPSLWSLTEDDIQHSPFYGSELGCSSSRCWAEINEKFGEPQGSVRRVKRFWLGAERELLSCNLSQFYGMWEENAEDESDGKLNIMEDNPGAILDNIYMKKMEEDRNGRLYRKLLVVNRNILESLFF